MHGLSQTLMLFYLLTFVVLSLQSLHPRGRTLLRVMLIKNKSKECNKNNMGKNASEKIDSATLAVAKLVATQKIMLKPSAVL